jgi:putative flippase GtrA
MERTYLVLPVYEPETSMMELVHALKEHFAIIVVDDGSSYDKKELFNQLEPMCMAVLHHEKNRGKGAALKTAFSYLIDHDCHGCGITADSDGQHRIEDILRIEEEMHKTPDTVILGMRDFAEMPPRSKFGNTLSGWAFRLGTGLKVHDTQTGLRGLPESIWGKLLEVEGERYEYEMNVLLNLKTWQMPFREIMIQTVYTDSNRSSHFRPLRDGLRVFSRIIKFCGSSLVCTLVDYALYSLFSLFLAPLWSYIFARVISASLNYQLSRRLVFHGAPSVKSGLQYALLVVIVMAIGSLAVNGFALLGINHFLVKLVVDTALFFMNYFVQKKIIFKRKAGKLSE